jgi:hypothetical protein
MTSNYETEDIHVCAFLLCQGASLDGLERERSGRVRFHIKRTENIDELLRIYWSNDAIAIVPSRLFASLKHLKSLVHSQP